MEKSSDELAPGLFYKPEDIGTWNTSKRFMYNSEKGTVCGRTGLSWGMLATMLVFFQMLDPCIPKWQVEATAIGTSPGMEFWPVPSETYSIDSLIWYKATERENLKHWTKKLDDFLEVYRTPGLTPGRGQNIANCEYYRPPMDTEVCDEDVKSWSPCTPENNYGYHKSTPCIFLKLNKINAWVPEYYNDTEHLPDNMPADLKKHIEEVKATKRSALNTVWVSCEGENPADVEFVGQIEYIPRRGFPSYFYPFHNNEGYLSPLVAIHFKRPKSGIVINIECKAWAKNIIHDKTNRIGSVHFELMID